ncbi:MAG: small multi-drug export protein [Gammaproteobacteria bacterium]|nr:small multi-drug export protein [Gammaproteobacteria bacterium]
MGIGFLYGAGIAISWFHATGTFQALVGMTAAHVLFGRAAGMSYGYSLGYGHGLVFSANIIIETIIVMLVYPLFVFTLRRLLVSATLREFMERVYRAAESRRRVIHRWGIPGIFLIVLFPFWGTGPVVGSVIGFLLGLRPWVNMAVVLGGTYMACVAWAILLKELHERVEAVSPYGGIAVVAVIVVFVVLGFFWGGRRTSQVKEPE